LTRDDDLKARVQRQYAIDPSKLGPNSPLLQQGQPTRRRGHPEDDHVRNYIAPLYEAAGFHVNVTSVVGVHPKGVTPGIPDLYCQSAVPRRNVWHEAKWDSRQSLAQWEFMQRCIGGAEFYVLGRAANAADFIEWMRAVGPYISTARWFDEPAFAHSLDQWGYRAPTRKHTRRGNGHK